MLSSVKQGVEHMWQQYLRGAVVCLLLVSTQAQSGTFDMAPLYRAEVVVQDKSNVAWHAAVAEALRGVLVKVSGDSTVNTLPAVDETYAALDRIVQQFSYKNQFDEQGNNQLMLQVNFDIDMVNDILARLEQPIWTGKRPRTLVWFLVNKEGKNLFLTDAEPESTWFIDSGKKRGIQVFFPTHDLAYNTVLDMPIEAPEMLTQLHTFSRIYPHEQLLIGQYSAAEETITWKLVIGEEEYLWTDQTADLEHGVQKGIDHITDDMVAHHAVFQEKLMESLVHMTVRGVRTLSVYQQFTDFLRHNPVVSHLNRVSIAKDTVTIEVMAKGGVDALAEALARQADLRMITDPAAYDEVELAYQWVGK